MAEKLWRVLFYKKICFIDKNTYTQLHFEHTKHLQNL